MHKKILWVLLLLPAFLPACSDEDTGNDARLIGRWETSHGMGPNNYATVLITATEYEFCLFEEDEGMLRAGEDSNKGSYTAKDGTMFATVTHEMDAEVNNYVLLTTPEKITNLYTISGSGIGAVCTIIQGTTTMYLTNVAPYVPYPALNGVWTNLMPNGSEGHEIWTMVFENGKDFTMTQMRTKYGEYTNVMREIDKGTTYCSEAAPNGWFESVTTQRREWESDGSETLKPWENTYIKGRMAFSLKNSGTVLELAGGLLELHKQ
jgi:hypothetical protein